MDGLPQPPQPPPPPPPGGGKDGLAPDGFGSGFQPQGNGGFGGGPEGGFGYGSQGGFPQAYPPANYVPGDMSYGGGFGAPPPPPQGAGYGGYPGGYDMYQQGFQQPPPVANYGGSFSSFDAGRGRDLDGRDRDSGRDGGRGYDGGRSDRGADRGSDRGDRGRRDYDRPVGDRGTRDYDRGGRDYDRGDRGDRGRGFDDRAADRRGDSGKGYDFGKGGYGRGMPLPEPVELQLKNLPLDATEPALRSLFGQKGLTFDTVEFYVTAKMTVSSQAQAEKVIQGFHMYQIAGRSIECVQVRELNAGVMAGYRALAIGPPRWEPTSESAEGAKPQRTAFGTRIGYIHYNNVLRKGAMLVLHDRRLDGTAAGRHLVQEVEEEEEEEGAKEAVVDNAAVTPLATREAVPVGLNSQAGAAAVVEAAGAAMMAGHEAFGSVLRYDEEKGFGFIKPDRGSEDVFVHFSNLPREYQRNGTQVLQTGDRVIFDQEIDQKKGKPCAKNVQIEGSGGGGGGPGRGGGGYGGGGGGPGPGRSQGTVSNWDGEKGFGFIKPDSGDKDLFVHFSSLPRNYQRGGDSTLRQGDRVTFVEAFDDAKGKSCAKNVQ
ncbi:unnamed protein product, partial [Symbiodinium microadriaticum]